VKKPGLIDLWFVFLNSEARLQKRTQNQNSEKARMAFNCNFNLTSAGSSSPTGKLDVYEGTGLKPLPLSPSKTRNERPFKRPRTSMENTYRPSTSHPDDSDEDMGGKDMDPYFAAQLLSFEGTKDLPAPVLEFMALPVRLLNFDDLVEPEVENDRFDVLPDEMVRFVPHYYIIHF